jgi:hypothetical protein
LRRLPDPIREPVGVMERSSVVPAGGDPSDPTEPTLDRSIHNTIAGLPQAAGRGDADAPAWTWALPPGAWCLKEAFRASPGLPAANR